MTGGYATPYQNLDTAVADTIKLEKKHLLTARGIPIESEVCDKVKDPNPSEHSLGYINALFPSWFHMDLVIEPKINGAENPVPKLGDIIEYSVYLAFTDMPMSRAFLDFYRDNYHHFSKAFHEFGFYPLKVPNLKKGGYDFKRERTHKLDMNAEFRVPRDASQSIPMEVARQEFVSAPEGARLDADYITSIGLVYDELASLDPEKYEDPFKRASQDIIVKVKVNSEGILLPVSFSALKLTAQINNFWSDLCIVE